MRINEFIIILVLFLAVNFSYSQEFGSPDSKWKFDIRLYYGYGTINFEKDSTIDSKSFNKFLITSQVIDSNDDTTSVTQPIFFNNSDGLVSFSTNGTSCDTLINYNAAPQDKWTIPHRKEFREEKYIITVIDTFTANFNEKKLKALSCTFHEEGGFMNPFVDTIYEHFGFRHSFILPYDGIDSALGSNIGGVPLCFSNNFMGIIELEPAFFLGSVFPVDCRKLSGFKEIDTDHKSFIIFPNPTDTELNISGISKTDHFKILNSSGQECHRGIYRDMIDVSELVPGIYFVVCGDRVGKFVKVP